jgi:two-component system, NtrC family, sensor kinase
MEPAPRAPETGAVEFRRLARRYNDLQAALAVRRREAAAQASRLALEERSRGLERLALAEETAAAFAHEIGTPLNVVSGHLQLLRDDLSRSGQGDGTDRVKTVLAQVDRVSAIVRARLDRGAWPVLDLREADLADITSRLASFMEPSLRQSGVKLEEKLFPARCRCDPVLVEQILLNLMKNAIEAMSAGGRLRLETNGDQRHAWLQVSDDGPGLSPEAKARLFQPFATTKGAAGTGLGLALSQRLAGAMGGSLEFLAGGRGTTWRLSLPGMTA